MDRKLRTQEITKLMEGSPTYINSFKRSFQVIGNLASDLNVRLKPQAIGAFIDIIVNEAAIPEHNRAEVVQKYIIDLCTRAIELVSAQEDSKRYNYLQINIAYHEPIQGLEHTFSLYVGKNLVKYFANGANEATATSTDTTSPLDLNTELVSFSSMILILLNREDISGFEVTAELKSTDVAFASVLEARLAKNNHVSGEG